VDRLQIADVFSCFIDANKLSKRIAISDIENSMHFPIEFAAPFPSGNPLGTDEQEVAKWKIANIDTVLKAIVKSHHADRQTVLDCFKRSKYRLNDP
jgi:hypothetical protein